MNPPNSILRNVIENIDNFFTCWINCSRLWAMFHPIIFVKTIMHCYKLYPLQIFLNNTWWLLRNIKWRHKNLTLNESIDDSLDCRWPCCVFNNIFEHFNVWLVLFFQISRPITVNWNSKLFELDIWEEPHCTFWIVGINFWKFHGIKRKIINIFRIFSTLGTVFKIMRKYYVITMT